MLPKTLFTSKRNRSITLALIATAIAAALFASAYRSAHRRYLVQAVSDPDTGIGIIYSVPASYKVLHDDPDVAVQLKALEMRYFEGAREPAYIGWVKRKLLHRQAYSHSALCVFAQRLRDYDVKPDSEGYLRSDPLAGLTGHFIERNIVSNCACTLETMSLPGRRAKPVGWEIEELTVHPLHSNAVYQFSEYSSPGERAAVLEELKNVENSIKLSQQVKRP